MLKELWVTWYNVLNRILRSWYIMLIVTTEKVEGKKISKVLGLVRGSTIRAKHVEKI